MIAVSVALTAFLNLSQYLSFASVDQWPSSMKTRRLFLPGMLWKVSLLWEWKDPVCSSLAAEDDDDDDDDECRYFFFFFIFSSMAH